MWRILSRAEARKFRYDDDPPDRIMPQHLGYVVMLEVRIDGHEHGGSSTEKVKKIHLFHMHPPMVPFPMHHTAHDHLLRGLFEDEVLRQLPGTVVATPSHVSYGWLCL